MIAPRHSIAALMAAARAGWCAGAGRSANEQGGCTYCRFDGKPTKHWVVRPHKYRGARELRCDCPTCQCGEDVWCCRPCHDLAAELGERGE